MRFRHLLLLLPLLALVPLLRLSAADEAEQRRKLDKLRTGNPARYAQLRQQTRAFLGLPEARREQLIKLDQDLHNEPSSVQRHLFEVMGRYADWLDRLPEAQRRQVLETKDKAQRLQLIRQLREQQWLRSQPRKIQQRVERLEKANSALVLARTVGQLAGQPDLAALVGVAGMRSHGPDPTAEFAAEYIAQVKLNDRKRHQEWQIARRHWEKLIEPRKEGLENRAIHFGKEVEHYVNYYLKYLLTKDEWDRLKAAEGHWPQYPYLL